jgi:hypothetical protein
MDLNSLYFAYKRKIFFSETGAPYLAHLKQNDTTALKIILFYRTWPLVFLETEDSQHGWGVRPYVDLWKKGFALQASLYRQSCRSDKPFDSVVIRNDPFQIRVWILPYKSFWILEIGQEKNENNKVNKVLYGCRKTF